MRAGAAVIYIVDDDMSARIAAGRLLRASGYQVSLHESANDLLGKLPAFGRGCILLDVQMPGFSGPQLQEQLSKMGCFLPIIFLTGHGDIQGSVRAIKAGAEDFLTKPVTKKVLIETIERALRHYDETHERNARLGTFRELFSKLTPREREVFALVVRGKLNKQIAYDLGTSERTIKAHRHNIMEKFKVNSLAELVSIAENIGALTGSLGS